MPKDIRCRSLAPLSVLVISWAIFSSQAIATNLTAELANFEAECQRLGFTPRTEKYGECVLDLHRRAPTARTANNMQNAPLQDRSTDKFVAECVKMGFREGTADSSNCALSLRRHEAEMSLYQRQLQAYERQVEQVEKANRLAAAQRLLEIANQGFSMAAGGSQSSASTHSRSAMPPPPPPLQFVSPGGSRYTCADSGVQLVCR
jgi:hypothetical protein